VYGGQSAYREYQLIVTARERDEVGTLLSSKTLKSDVVRVTVDYGFSIPMDVVTQPQNMTVKNGDGFTLNVGVSVPEGIELTYQWYQRNNPIAGATSPELRLDSKSSHYPAAAYSEDYHCKITAYEKDGDGNVTATRTVRSQSARVSVTKNGWNKLYDITLAPFVNAFGGTVAMLGMTLGFALPVSPIIFIFFLLYGFFEGVRGLF
jgi:hypothetical protein